MEHRQLGQEEEAAVTIAVLASVVSLAVVMVLTYRDPLLAGHRGDGLFAAVSWAAAP
jgi:hypothetical protein